MTDAKVKQREPLVTTTVQLSLRHYDMLMEMKRAFPGLTTRAILEAAISRKHAKYQTMNIQGTAEKIEQVAEVPRLSAEQAARALEMFDEQPPQTHGLSEQR